MITLSLAGLTTSKNHVVIIYKNHVMVNREEEWNRKLCCSLWWGHRGNEEDMNQVKPSWQRQCSTVQYSTVQYRRLSILQLTAHNWQRWKSKFLTCPYRKIYRVEAVGLKMFNILLKLQFLCGCEIWGNFVKIWYFVNKCLICLNLKILLHIYDTCNCN